MLKHGSEQDQQDIRDFYLSYSSPIYDSAPVYLQKDLLFPYQFGLEFVYSLNDKGGYTLVDQAFLNPPKTTEQILHPDKYPAEGAVNVSLPDVQSVLPETWSKIDENMLGEWYSFLVMAHGHEKHFALPETAARAAHDSCSRKQREHRPPPSGSDSYPRTAMSQDSGSYSGKRRESPQSEKTVSTTLRRRRYSSSGWMLLP